jgi:Xaa-Pro aminopeptidase
MAQTERPAAEANARRLRLEEQLDRDGVTAAVIANKQNFHYLTGYRTPSWALRARPIFLVVRPGKRPAAVVNAGEAERIAEHIPDVEPVTYQAPASVTADGYTILDFAPSAIDRLQELLRPLGNRVGFELGSQMTPRIPYSALHQIQQDLDLDLSDITAKLWRLRLTKSTSEIDLIRRAAQALTDTYQRFEQDARPGMTEQELHGIFLACAKQTEAERVGYLIVIAGTAGAVVGPPTDKIWMPGQLLLVDAGLIVGGYWSDFSRLYCAENATKAQHEAYQSLLAALARGRAASQPGATAATVSSALHEPNGDAAKDSFGRVGHGIGLDITEPPSLHHHDETLLEPRMTLCLEPNRVIPDLGLVVAEEMISITEAGAELLSSSYPAELPVISR